VTRVVGTVIIVTGFFMILSSAFAFAAFLVALVTSAPLPPISEAAGIGLAGIVTMAYGWWMRGQRAKR